MSIFRIPIFCLYSILYSDNTCPNCHRVCGSRIGLISHLRGTHRSLHVDNQTRLRGIADDSVRYIPWSQRFSRAPGRRRRTSGEAKPNASPHRSFAPSALPTARKPLGPGYPLHFQIYKEYRKCKLASNSKIPNCTRRSFSSYCRGVSETRQSQATTINEQAPSLKSEAVL